MKTFLELAVSVSYDYRPGKPAFTSGLPENCHPGSDATVEITEVLIGNFDILPHLTAMQIEELEAECLEDAQDRVRDAAEARADEIRDRRMEDAE